MYLTDEELEKYYNELAEYHRKYLKEYGVNFFKLKFKSSGRYVFNSLALIYLYVNFQKPVSKEELTDFILQYTDSNKEKQQGRHLGQQEGWYVISGERPDEECSEYNVKPDEYCLISVEKYYPKFSKLKRQHDLTDDEWETIKRDYDFRCATCGSKEGRKNYHYNTKTKLQKGHIDPNKPLTSGNIIPQCQNCNQTDQDNFVYTEKGRVKEIANARFVLRSNEKVKEEMFELLKEDLKK